MLTDTSPYSSVLLCNVGIFDPDAVPKKLATFFHSLLTKGGFVALCMLPELWTSYRLSSEYCFGGCRGRTS